MARYSLELSAKATDALVRIRRYIAFELQNPTAAANTVRRIKKAAMDLRSFPNGWPRVEGEDLTHEYRKRPVGNFVIVFRVDEARRKVVVSGIYSSYQDYVRSLR